jgi:dolichol-phosphate mannosyltransferase
VPASDVFVSVVAPLEDDADVLPDFVREVMEVLEGAYANFELVLVNDGSRDRTPAVVDGLLKQHRCLRYLRLSRRFGREVAIAAGLDTVIGDYTVVMIPESDPPALVPELVRRARAGRGVVYGRIEGAAKEPLWSRAGAAVFWSIARRVLGIEAPRGATYFQALSRQAVNALTRIREKYRSLRLLTTIAGYEAEAVPYAPLARRRAPKSRGFFESVSLAIGIVVSQSTAPLRIVSGLGLFASALNLAYMLYVLAIYFLKSHVQEGWTTTSLQVSGMFFLLFLILSVLSEYVGRVLEETRDRPLYHLLEERTSNVMVADAERRNVVKESV